MKKLLWLIAILFVLVIAAGLLAPYFISADTVKRQLIAKVEAATGRTLTIDGAFNVRFFPVAGVTMEQVTLSNLPGDGDKTPFMLLKSLSVDVAVLPLLHGGVEVKDMVLDEPRINLRKTKDGGNNWQLAVTPHEPEAQRDPAQPLRASQDYAPSNLSLNNVRLKNGTVTYADDAAKKNWSVQKLSADVSLEGFSSPFSVNGDGEWNGKAVKIKANIDSLQSFFAHARTKVVVSVKSDLLALDADGVVEKEHFTGKAGVNSTSLKSLMAWANPAAKAPGTPAPLALDLKSDVSCSAVECSLSNAAFSLDKIQATGSVKAAFGGEVPQIALDLTANTLDFNPFLPPQADASGGLLVSEAVADGGHWSDDPIDLSGLKAADLTANIQTDGILWRKFTIGKTALRATLNQGHLTADIPEAAMYDGKGSLTLDVDSSGIIGIRSNFKGIQAEKLLKDAAGIDRLSGTADISLTISGHGRSEREIVAALAGNGQIKMPNGVIKGVNIADMLHNIQSAFAGGGAQQTAITDAAGTFTIAQGIVTNRDLAMTLPGMRVTGQGDVNLPAYTVNYRLTPQMLSGQGAAAKEGIGVPVLIAGNLDHPTLQPDLKAALQNALQNPDQFKEQLKNSRGNLKDQLKNLKGLLGGQGN